MFDFEHCVKKDTGYAGSTRHSCGCASTGLLDKPFHVEDVDGPSLVVQQTLLFERHGGQRDADAPHAHHACQLIVCELELGGVCALRAQHQPGGHAGGNVVTLDGGGHVGDVVRHLPQITGHRPENGGVGLQQALQFLAVCAPSLA